MLYEISVWLHLVAAAIWLGGMLFLVLVVVPWLRAGGRADAVVLLRETGRRFRSLGWACFAVFLITGIFNLSMRGVRLADLFASEWIASSFGRIVWLKLALFAAIVALSALHDFVVGPKAAQALELDAQSSVAQSLRRRASVLGRLNVVLALIAVFVGVMIVRGAP